MHSKDKKAMLTKGSKARAKERPTPDEEIKDPYVLEFLGIKDEYSETDMEEALIHHLEMHLYLNYAKEHWAHDDENPPIGLILCAKKDALVAKYALEGLPNKVIAAQYRMALPQEKKLVEELTKTQKLLTTVKSKKK